MTTPWNSLCAIARRSICICWTNLANDLSVCESALYATWWSFHHMRALNLHDMPRLLECDCWWKYQCRRAARRSLFFAPFESHAKSFSPRSAVKNQNLFQVVIDLRAHVLRVCRLQTAYHGLFVHNFDHFDGIR